MAFIAHPPPPGQLRPPKIPRRLHGTPAQAFCPEGTCNVKPTGQHHLCCHKWRVAYPVGTVFLTLSRHCLHEGRHPPNMYSCKAPCGRWSAWPTCLICKGQALWVCFAAIFGMTQTHGGRHTSSLSSLFRCACLCAFVCAKS